jgi:transcriptional regulator, GntR family
MRGPQTLQRGLYNALRESILQGQLQANCRLPGSRIMAQRLAISRNTVNSALEQLALEGYLLRDRQGTRVASLPKTQATVSSPVLSACVAYRFQQLPPATPRESPPMLFTPGTPAINYFPLPLWRRFA